MDIDDIYIEADDEAQAIGLKQGTAEYDEYVDRFAQERIENYQASAYDTWKAYQRGEL